MLTTFRDRLARCGPATPRSERDWRTSAIRSSTSCTSGDDVLAVDERVDRSRGIRSATCSTCAVLGHVQVLPREHRVAPLGDASSARPAPRSRRSVSSMTLVLGVVEDGSPPHPPSDASPRAGVGGQTARGGGRCGILIVVRGEVGVGGERAEGESLPWRNSCQMTCQARGAWREPSSSISTGRWSIPSMRTCLPGSGLSPREGMPIDGGGSTGVSG